MLVVNSGGGAQFRRHGLVRGPVPGPLGLGRLRDEAHLAPDSFPVRHVIYYVLVPGLAVSLGRLLVGLPNVVDLVGSVETLRCFVVLDLQFFKNNPEFFLLRLGTP